MNLSILIVDDQKELLTYLTDLLAPRYTVDLSESLQDGLKKAREKEYNLIIVDLDLPDGNGFELITKIYENGASKNTPKIMLSGHGELQTRTRAYECGVQNFIEKPFFKEEFVAIVDSILVGKNERSLLTSEKIGLNIKSLSLKIEGENIELTPKEFKMLNFLIENVNQVITRETILTAIWGGAHVTHRVIDNHINSLRKKIGNDSIKIESIYSEGYRLIMASQKFQYN